MCPTGPVIVPENIMFCVAYRLQTKKLLIQIRQISHVGLESFVEVNIKVEDINDNKPELQAEDIFVCENDMSETVRETVIQTQYLQ